MTRLAPMSEDDLLTAILELAALTGWLAYHVRNSRAGVIQGDIGRASSSPRRRSAGGSKRWPRRVLAAPADWTNGTIEADLR